MARDKFFHLHAHSEFSHLDGMAPVSDMIEKAVANKQPALALTDHGNMAGAFQLYKGAKAAGILPFPGIEAYVILNDAKEAERYHMLLTAVTTKGYQSLVQISTGSHTRERFHYKPRVLLSDLADLDLSGIYATTGCYFGLLIQTLLKSERKAERMLSNLQAMFDDRLFVEIQMHGKDEDRDLADRLYSMGLEHGVRPIITQDAHYCEKAHKPLHDLMKVMGYKSKDPGDNQFPGDSYHLATTPWVRRYYEGMSDLWSDAQESYGILLDAHKLRIPPLDKYAYHVPFVAKNAQDKLVEMCLTDGWEQKIAAVEEIDSSKKKKDIYQARLEYELEIIGKLGFADYFLLVHDYVSWCREQNIFVNARGSANGSLVCYLIGLTNVDPIKWKLSFDRFLTLDRERPPDIDLDIEDTRRADVIAYLQSKYDMRQIGTFSRLGYDEETGRGSLFVHYLAARRNQLPSDEYKAMYGDVKSLHDLDRVEPVISKQIRLLSNMTIRSSAGAHAAGFVLSAPKHNISDWLPLMFIGSSGLQVTQMMMDDVEDAGYVKIDLLGLRSLTTLKRVLELIDKDDEGVSCPWIPLDDKETFKFLRRGVSESGIFQMEGYTAAKGCRELGVKSVKDMILVNALYRPAGRDSGYLETFLENRANRHAIEYPHPVYERHLSETFGVPAFQEQVLAVLRDLGMDSGSMNKLLKAVKASSREKVAKAYETFRQTQETWEKLCATHNMSKHAIEFGWELLEGFAAYGFNRAHATAYSLLGYHLAFLKVHYPLEFHTGLLETTAGTPKEAKYLHETRRVGIKIRPVDINVSGLSWSIDRKAKAIRRGFLSIKGVGHGAASELVVRRLDGPYTSIEDVIQRCEAKKVTGGKAYAKDGTLTGVLLALRNARAFSSLGVTPDE